MIKIFLIILLNFQIQPSSMCFKKIFIAQANNIIENKDNLLPNASYQVKGSYAYVYPLKSGEIVMIPNDFGSTSDNAFLFENESCFNSISNTERDIFLQEEENIFAKEFSIIQEIPKNIPKIIRLLAKKTNIPIPEDEFEIDNSSLLFLIEKGKEEFSNLSEKERMYLCILFGEYLVRTNNAQWGLKKEYGKFTNYDIPVLLMKDNNVLKLTDYFIILTNWTSRNFTDLIRFFPTENFCIHKSKLREKINYLE